MGKPPSSNGWSRVKLSKIIRELPSGVSVNGEGRAADVGEFGVLKVSSVANGRFFPEENKVVSSVEAQRARLSASRGDLLISRSNTFDLVGASAIVGDDFPNLYLPDKLWKVVLGDSSRDSVDWLLHVLNSPTMRKSLKSIATGTSGSMKNISKPSFLSIQVLRPQFYEQRKIAAVLSTWDRAIELTEKLIAAKQKRKQALMQQLLTGKVRFREFKGKSWREAKLGKLFRERRESGYAQLALLSITSGEGIVHRDSLDRKDSSNADKSRYLRICPGDIGYNTMRMWQGVSALSGDEGIVSPAYTICTPNTDVDAVFMSYLFKFSPVVHVFWRYSQGMVDDTLNLKFSAFSTIKAWVPLSKEEQERIGWVFSGLDEEIRLMCEKAEKLRRQKSALMQQLLTGKVRVNVDAEVATG